MQNPRKCIQTLGATGSQVFSFVMACSASYPRYSTILITRNKIIWSTSMRVCRCWHAYWILSGLIKPCKVYGKPIKNHNADIKFFTFASRNPSFVIVSKPPCIIKDGLLASEFISRHFSSRICKMNIVLTLWNCNMSQSINILGRKSCLYDSAILLFNGCLTLWC